MRAVDAEGVHEAHRVVGHHGRAVRHVRRVALPDSAIVEGDDAILRGERRNLQPPREMVAAEAHDEHQRVAGARLEIEHLDVADA